MNSNFSDVERAVVFLSSGLTSAFPEGEAEVLLFRGQSVAVRHTRATTRQIKPLLDQWCRNFRGASVSFTPEHVYGMVAVMESHPEFTPEGKKPKHPEEEPRVVILLRRNADREILLGTCDKPPKQPYRAVAG